MCGRLSQYHRIHDFVDALSIPCPLANSVGDQPLERYNVAPTTRVALLRLEDGVLHADLVRWGWRPHWAKDRAAPINARVKKVAHGAFFRAIWPHRTITPVDGMSGLMRGDRRSSPITSGGETGNHRYAQALASSLVTSMTDSGSSPPMPRVGWLMYTIAGLSCCRPNLHGSGPA
ncbi:putative SOS response-associated peptidase YedK [compost metagenome]